MTRPAVIALAAAFLSACLGVGDSLVAVHGKLEDEKGQPYERCVVSLTLDGEDQALDSVRVEGDSLEGGQMEVSFHVPGRWKDCFVAVECDGAESRFISERIGKERPIPLGLGTIVLEREP